MAYKRKIILKNIKDTALESSKEEVNLSNDDPNFESRVIDGRTYKVPKTHNQFVPMRARHEFPDSKREGYKRYWAVDANHHADIAPLERRGWTEVKGAPRVWAGNRKDGSDIWHILYEIPLEIYEIYEKLETDQRIAADVNRLNFQERQGQYSRYYNVPGTKQFDIRNIGQRMNVGQK
jgi:hypothetical protein